MISLVFILSLTIGTSTDEIEVIPQVHSPPADGFEGFHQVLEDCFNGNLKNSHLTISGIDRNGGILRHVELTFKLKGMNGNCHLRLNPPFKGKYIVSYPNNPERQAKASPEPSFTSALRGFVLGRVFTYPDEPNIYIYIENNPSARPLWHLTLLFPRGVVSGGFLRSFIAQGMDAHSSMVNKVVKLELTDESDARQLYWLEKGTGETYYEGVWDLSYRCFLFGNESRTPRHLRTKFEAAQWDSPRAAFADLNFDPILIDGDFALTKTRYYFHRQFVTLITRWIRANLATTQRMSTIREALDSFIPFWLASLQTSPQNAKVKRDLIGGVSSAWVEYNQPGEMPSDSLLTPKQKAIKIYAIETFMFFFRHHPNFEILQRQVLGRASCRDMTGIPPDLVDPVNFHTTYTPPQRKTKKVGIVRPFNYDFSFVPLSTSLFFIFSCFIIFYIQFVHHCKHETDFSYSKL